MYSSDEIERRLAFFDVITTMSLLHQTEYADSIRHIRALNSNVVILTYCDAENVYQAVPDPSCNVDLGDQLRQGICPYRKPRSV